MILPSTFRTFCTCIHLVTCTTEYFQSSMIFFQQGRKSNLYFILYHQSFRAGFCNSKTLQVIEILLQFKRCYSEHEGPERYPDLPARIRKSSMTFPSNDILYVYFVTVFHIWVSTAAKFRWIYQLPKITFSVPCPSFKQKPILHFLIHFEVQKHSFHFQAF